MARNRISIAAQPSEVFETLADPFAYPKWVVGTAQVRDADSSWPQAGARFSYRAGPFPFRWNGSTEVTIAEPDRRLVLRTDLPFGSVEIDIELHAVGDGTEVSLTETATESPARMALDVAFHFRNAGTLARLKALVEGASERGVHVDVIPALGRRSHWLDGADFAEVVGAAERCYLAVETKKGPHVTPTAFAHSSGRVWILTPRSSLKARRLSRGSPAGILFRSHDRSVIVAGHATVHDPARLWMPEDLMDRARAVPALGRYVAEQRTLLSGLFTGALSSLTELNPIERVLISIAPQGILLVDRDDIVTRRGGRPYPDGDPAGHADPSRRRGPELDLDDVPDSIAALAEEGRRRAVLAVETPQGPLALPARWHTERSLASVPSTILGGFAHGRVGLCLDGDDGSDLDDKEGMLVRGRGRVVGVQGGYAAVAIDQDKTTVWRGADTATVDN